MASQFRSAVLPHREFQKNESIIWIINRRISRDWKNKANRNISGAKTNKFHSGYRGKKICPGRSRCSGSLPRGPRQAPGEPNCTQPDYAAPYLHHAASTPAHPNSYRFGGAAVATAGLTLTAALTEGAWGSQASGASRSAVVDVGGEY